jgi:hypothetical protein
LLGVHSNANIVHFYSGILMHTAATCSSNPPAL